MTLYHASQQKSLKSLTPQPTKSNDEYIGDFLFATKDYKLALMYLAPKGVATLMNPDKKPDIVICADPESFKKKDKGGAIYELSADSFTKTPQEALSNYEMVSTKAVKPVGKSTFDSVLAAMHKAGIQIRFVDEKLFHKLIKNPKQEEMIQEIPLYSQG